MYEQSKCIINDDGSVFWRLPNGKSHRLDGPAAIWYDEDGPNETWYQYGERHRLDGPAVIWESYPTAIKEWWIAGNNITDEIIEWSSELQIDLDNLTEHDIFLIGMKFT